MILYLKFLSSPLKNERGDPRSPQWHFYYFFFFQMHLFLFVYAYFLLTYTIATYFIYATVSHWSSNYHSHYANISVHFGIFINSARHAGVYQASTYIACHISQTL